MSESKIETLTTSLRALRNLCIAVATTIDSMTNEKYVEPPKTGCPQCGSNSCTILTAFGDRKEQLRCDDCGIDYEGKDV